MQHTRHGVSPDHLHGRRFAAILAVAAGLLLVPRPAAAEWVLRYADAMRAAGTDGRPVCLYFGDPALAACQRFESQVLAHPRVAEQMTGCVSVRVNPVWDEALAEKCGIYRMPAIVLLDSKGTIRFKEQRNLTTDALLAALAQVGAKQVRTVPRPATAPTAPVTEEGVERSGNSGIAVAPPTTAPPGQPIRIQARVEQAQAAKLHYRVRGTQPYVSEPMRPVESYPGLWEGWIPAEKVTANGLEFYLSARVGERTLAAPKEFYRNPFVIEAR